MERKKLIGLGAIIAAFIAFTAWTVFSIPDAPPEKPDSKKTREMEYGENTIREEVGGKLLWELTTSSSSMDIKTQATTSDEEKMTSKELEWVSGKDRLVATGTVKVSQPGMTLEADRVESWNKFQEFRATGHAHLVKEQDKKGEKAK